MMWIFASLLEQIFPERPDYKLVRQATSRDLILLLSPTDHGDFISLLPFSESLVKALIHEAKFHHNKKAWRLLGEGLSSYLKHYPSNTMLVPIPLSSKRQRKRGYNQVEEVAKKAIKQNVHIKLSTETLFRPQDTIPQTSLTKKERLTNVRDAFSVQDRISINNTKIIILDDVVTTGATLKAARASLAPHHPLSITLLALAH